MNKHLETARQYFEKAREEVRGYRGLWGRAFGHLRQGKWLDGLKLLLAAVVVLALGIALFQLLLVPVVGLGVVVGFVIVLLGPPLWVFIDSTNREMKRPFLWGMFALLAPLIGAVIYLIVRPEWVRKVACQSCQKMVREDYQVCPWCGAASSNGPKSCPSCHSVLEMDWAFCPYCRLNLTQPVAAHASAAGTSFCQFCGAALGTEWKFCPYCQEKVRQSAS